MNVCSNSNLTLSAIFFEHRVEVRGRGGAAEVVVPVGRPLDLHVLAGDQRLRPGDRGVLLGRRVGQRLVVVGPRLVVVVDRGQLRVGEDRQQLLEPAAGLELEPAALVELPAALPPLLVLVGARVALPGPGLDVVEPDVLDAGAVGPRLLAGHRAGVAADALVEVHHHRHLGHDPHQYSTSWRAPADDGDLVALVAGGAEVVEGVGQLGVAADQVAWASPAAGSASCGCRRACPDVSAIGTSISRSWAWCM